jgi:alanine-glyoxylate transaminase/serine-glyoxylate transaminase/serine-pyruvate transaminase
MVEPGAGRWHNPNTVGRSEETEPMRDKSRDIGRQLLQIPGPTNVPERVLRAIARPTIDHRSPEFADLTRRILDGLKLIFKTSGAICIFPSSGTGAWEAALVNALAPGERVVMFETGYFAKLWREMAGRLGLQVDFIESTWGNGVDAGRIEALLADDRDKQIKAVCVVHNETSTGVASDVASVRRAIDGARHPALLMVDTVSSLASFDFRHDDWGIDVTVSCSQKGLMLPPGIGFNAVSAKALAAAKTTPNAPSYWSWEAALAALGGGGFPYTPPTNLLFGLAEAIAMIEDEGLENTFRRHARLGRATRAAVAAWGFDTVCRQHDCHSDSLTAVVMPEGVDADAFRQRVRARFNVALGNGLGKLAGRVFRIGHLGDINEPMLIGALSAIEMSLAGDGAAREGRGVTAAIEALADETSSVPAGSK